jgi:predicted phosphodiesterase
MVQKPLPHPFTVAILSDIHGNFLALEAVLADLCTKPYDQLVIAGDLVMNGPHPAETLACIRALQVPTLYGETDQAVAEANGDNALARWTAEQIGESGVAYLDGLPFSHTIRPLPNASPEADLLIVHASPTNAAAFLILEPNVLDERCSTVTPDNEALGMLGETKVGMIIHGHLHYPSHGLVRNQQLVSIGSVGFSFDGNPQAAYALATWDGSRWNIRHRRVSYDYERVIEAMNHSGQPLAETMIQRLRTAHWCPQ